MLLAKEFVSYLSRQLVQRLAPTWIETSDPTMAAEFFASVIVEDWLYDRLGPTVYAVTGWALLAVLVSISAWMVYTDISRTLRLFS